MQEFKLNEKEKESLLHVLAIKDIRIKALTKEVDSHKDTIINLNDEIRALRDKLRIYENRDG